MCVWFWGVNICALVVWRSVDNLKESVPSFHHVGPEGGTRATRFGSKQLPAEPSQHPLLRFSNL